MTPWGTEIVKFDRDLDAMGISLPPAAVYYDDTGSQPDFRSRAKLPWLSPATLDDRYVPPHPSSSPSIQGKLDGRWGGIFRTLKRPGMIQFTPALRDR